MRRMRSNVYKNYFLKRHVRSAIAELPTLDDTKAFLETHQATPVDANAAYAKAIALADKTDRRVFVHLSAPW